MFSSLKTKSRIAVLAVAAVLGTSAQAAEITGAGASFVFPTMSRWSADYNEATGHRVNYQSIGSGGGIAQIKAGTVDFGSSDKPLTSDELAAAGLGQFPSAIGGVVPVVNIAGIKPGRIDGLSTLTSDRDGLVMEAMRWVGARGRPAYCGFRTEDRLYVRYSTGEEELYDYTRDPYELDNVVDDPAYAADREALKRQTRQACSPTPPGFAWDSREARLRQGMTARMQAEAEARVASGLPAFPAPAVPVSRSRAIEPQEDARDQAPTDPAPRRSSLPVRTHVFESWRREQERRSTEARPQQEDNEPVAAVEEPEPAPTPALALAPAPRSTSRGGAAAPPRPPRPRRHPRRAGRLRCCERGIRPQAEHDRLDLRDWLLRRNARRVRAHPSARPCIAGAT